MSGIDDLPPYLLIAQELRDLIVRGDLAPGAPVPSVREIASRWQVARTTASKALAALREQGLVESRTGSGTYVRPPHAAPGARERFVRSARLGTAYSDTESVTFPFVGLSRAPEHVATLLGLDIGAPVIERRRVISDTEGPIELSTSWFAAEMAEIAPPLAQPQQIRGGTVKLLADALRIRPVYAREQMCARTATGYETAVLGLTDAAVLVCRLTIHDGSGRSVELDEAIYPANRWAYRQEYAVDL
ncbi:GntR family transcriptional regulator [Nocardia sp. alder85J]|uniref:GntR family transcriptional regulator n=1 Tax=Nocardia sp. alder85J TaxID=2862949 RepID=UPI001CD47D8C|nr:GntR family transcriptional regulator [Nocardia sp. alder85J]MCX4094433.1 GntR family transcriptional regulator [Nocardia sp. alder85J]